MKKRSKSQSRSKSIFLLSLVLLLLATALIFTFISFSYGEDGIKRYRGTLGAIDKGIDINGGFIAVLEPLFETDADKNNINENIKEAAKVIGNRLSASGYKGATAVEQTAPNGDKSIRVEIPKSDSVKSISTARSVISTFSTKGIIELQIQDEDEPFISNSDIRYFSVHAASSGGYGVLLEMTGEGLQKLIDKTKASIGKKLEIKLDGQALGQASELKEAFTSDPFIPISETRDGADNFAALLNGGVNPVKFKSFQSNSKEISAVLGENILTTLLVAGIIGVVLAIAIMLIFYKGLGLSAVLSMLVYIVVLLFILSQLPIQLSLAGVIAILLSIGIFAGANITILERIKEEYALGRSLVTSISNGFKRAGAAVIDLSVVVFILAILLLIFGGVARDFAIILTIGIVLSIALCYTITRLFIKLLLPINNKPKFYGLKRGIIEDEE